MKLLFPKIIFLSLFISSCSSITFKPTLEKSPITINDQTDSISSKLAPEIREFPKFEAQQVNHFQLKNGLTVLHFQTQKQLTATTLVGLFLHNPEPYNPINLQLNANWNLINIDNVNLRATALAANLGTKIQRIYDSIATGWYFEVLNQNQSDAFNLISKLLNNRTYNATELVHQKQKYSLEQQLKGVSGLSLSQQLYKKLVFSKQSSVSKIARSSSRKKLLDKLTEHDLKEYFQNHFNANKMVLIVLSPTSPDQLKSSIQTSFKQFPQAKPKSVSKNKTHKDSNNSLSLIRPSTNLYAISRPYSTQVDIRISFIPLSLNKTEYQSLKLFADVLAGRSLNSRMQSDLRERQGLSYSISHQLNQVSDFHSLHFLSSTENHKLPALYDGMQQHIDHLLTNGISRKEFNFIKQRRLVNLQRSRLHPYRKMSFMLQNFTNDNPLHNISHEAQELSKLSYDEFLSFVQRLKNQQRISIFTGDKSRIRHHMCKLNNCHIQWFSKKFRPQK